MALNGIAKVETFSVYRYHENIKPNDLGELPAPTKKNMIKLGELTGRVTSGDTLEPDIIGPTKDVAPDMSSWWLGFFDINDSFTLRNSDWLFSNTDNKRVFQCQFVDEYPGGIRHHIEVKLHTNDAIRDK